MILPKRWQLCGCNVKLDAKYGPWCSSCGGVIEMWYRSADRLQILAAYQQFLEVENQERLSKYQQVMEEIRRRNEEEEKKKKRAAKRQRITVAAVIVGLAILVAPFAAMGAEGVWNFLTRLVIGMVVVVVTAVIIIIWFVWMMSIDKEPPPRTREEALGRQIDAMAGYIATDDKAWHKFWSLWD